MLSLRPPLGLQPSACGGPDAEEAEAAAASQGVFSAGLGKTVWTSASAVGATRAPADEQGRSMAGHGVVGVQICPRVGF